MASNASEQNFANRLLRGLGRGVDVFQQRRTVLPDQALAGARLLEGKRQFDESQIASERDAFMKRLEQENLDGILATAYTDFEKNVKNLGFEPEVEAFVLSQGQAKVAMGKLPTLDPQVMTDARSRTAAGVAADKAQTKEEKEAAEALAKANKEKRKFTEAGALVDTIVAGGEPPTNAQRLELTGLGFNPGTLFPKKTITGGPDVSGDFVRFVKQQEPEREVPRYPDDPNSRIMKVETVPKREILARAFQATIQQNAGEMGEAQLIRLQAQLTAWQTIYGVTDDELTDAVEALAKELAGAGQ